MKVLRFFGILYSALLLTSCGTEIELGEPVYLFEHITQEPVTLLIYQVSDGEQTISYRVPSENKTESYEEILEKLQKVEAYPVLTSETLKLTYPIYSVFALDDGEAGENVEFVWSNGYLYNRDGVIYAFDFDFGALVEEYDMTYREEYDVTEGVAMNCRYYIAQGENGWLKDRLVPDDSDGASTDEVIAEQTEVFEDHVEVTIKNIGGRALRYWIVESVDVKLGDTWYDVPRLPGDTLWDCPVDLPAGTSAVYSCGTDEEYGTLPAGEYRVKIPVTFEGDLGSEHESMNLYCEFIID